MNEGVVLVHCKYRAKKGSNPPVAKDVSPAEGGRSLPTALFSPHLTIDPTREGLLRSWEDALTPPAKVQKEVQGVG